MRIVCPECSAAYDVPEAALTRNRLVRCARCRAQWSPVTRIPLDTLNMPTPAAPTDSSPPASLPPASLGPVSPGPASSVERAIGAATMPVRRPSAEPAARPEPESEPAMAAGSTPRWLTAASATTPHETLAIEQLTANGPQPGRRNAGPLWLLSLLIIVLAIGAAYVWREPVMRAWPPSIRVYQTFGLGDRA